MLTEGYHFSLLENDNTCMTFKMLLTLKVVGGITLLLFSCSLTLQVFVSGASLIKCLHAIIVKSKFCIEENGQDSLDLWIECTMYKGEYIVVLIHHFRVFSVTSTISPNLYALSTILYIVLKEQNLHSKSNYWAKL